MTWVLVAIHLASAGQASAYAIGDFQTMTECFYMRQEVLVSLEAYNGVPPVNSQYICLQSDKYQQ